MIEIDGQLINPAAIDLVVPSITDDFVNVLFRSGDWQTIRVSLAEFKGALEAHRIRTALDG